MLEVCQFSRDASVAESWLMAQEPYLASSDYGQTVDAVEKLLKRHEAFEKSSATWEERIAALRKLTTVRKAWHEASACPATVSPQFSYLPHSLPGSWSSWAGGLCARGWCGTGRRALKLPTTAWIWMESWRPGKGCHPPPMSPGTLFPHPSSQTNKVFYH